MGVDGVRSSRCKAVLMLLLLAPLSATAALGTAPCIGDCDGDHAVTVDELILMVNIALGSVAQGACPARRCGDEQIDISIHCTVAAINNALNGCPGPEPAPKIRYRLEVGGLSRYAPPRPSTGQVVIDGGFDLTVSADGRELTLTDVSLRLGHLNPMFITGDGLIEVAENLRLRADLSIDGRQVELAGEAPRSALWGNPPSIRDVTICGAPTGAVACATLSAGETVGYALSFSAAPQVTQTPGPTPTATPVVLTRYRVLEGSSIARRDGGAVSAREPLSGTFTVAPCPRVPNTFFALVITAADLDAGPGYAISPVEPQPVGCPGGVGVGYMDALTLYFPPEIYAVLRLAIDGREVSFNGAGLYEPGTGWRFGAPPVVENLRFCGSPDAPITCRNVDAADLSYELVISAAPEP